jgi:hypothetical protein
VGGGQVRKGLLMKWKFGGCCILHTGTQVFVPLLLLEAKNMAREGEPCKSPSLCALEDDCH